MLRDVQVTPGVDSMMELISMRRVWAKGLLIACLAGASFGSWVKASDTAMPPSESVGLSSERLTRIDSLMRHYVEEGVFPGMIVAVSRRGQTVYFKSFGFSDLQTREPLTSESIFRIYSMTKPITAAALMILLEEGKLLLDDSVAKYIPSFKRLKAHSADEGAEGSGWDGDSRTMTVRDLLRHTSGLGYGWGTDPVSRQYQAVNVFDPSTTLEEMVEKLAELPLYFEPGTQWRYSSGIDVAGRLIEILSGKSLDVFLQERLFGPLGMSDTSFYIADEKMSRLTNVYQLAEDGSLQALPQAAAIERYQEDHNRLLSGGGGLISTAADYMRFAQMLANGGELGGERILSRKTVELLATNHLDPRLEMGWPKLNGHGFGLAVSVLTDLGKSPTVGSVGDYGWDGAASTYFRIDPSEDLVILLMTHRMPCDTEIQVKLKTLVYQALVD